MKNESTGWQVVRQPFVPYLKDVGPAPFSLERGHLLQWPKGVGLITPDRAKHPEMIMMSYVPQFLHLYPTDAVVDVMETFKGNSAEFRYHFFLGAIEDKHFEAGIWFIRGQFGPGNKEISLLQAGMQRRWIMNQELQSQLLNPEYFDALMGNRCLSKIDGKFFIIK